MLRLRIFSGNARRAGLKAQQVRETRVGRLWFSLDTTPNCNVKRKGRGGQNIRESEEGRLGSAGRLEIPRTLLGL